jgi:branched-chain amino acid transport system permease protein
MRARLLRFAVLIAVIFVLGRLLPGVVNPYLLQIITLCGINIILAVSLNLINGFTGQFSLGHAGFMAVGAYLSAAFTYFLARDWVAVLASRGVPETAAEAALFLCALALGGGVAAVVGFLVGLPSLRLRGDYLAIVTLGFGEIIRVIFLNIEAVGAARGFSDIPAWSGLTWVLLWTALAIAVIWNVVHSTHGRAFISVREDEIASEALGIDTTRYKVVAFVIGAFFAGVAGGLFAHYLGYVHTNSFSFIKSIEIVIMVVLGGMGSITGSVLAAIVLTLMPEVLRPVKDYRMVLYSFLLIVLMIARPQGLLGTREVDLGALASRLGARFGTRFGDRRGETPGGRG